GAAHVGRVVQLASSVVVEYLREHPGVPVEEVLVQHRIVVGQGFGEPRQPCSWNLFQRRLVGLVPNAANIEDDSIVSRAQPGVQRSWKKSDRSILDKAVTRSRKPVPPDGKLESRLTTKDLEALQEAFNYEELFDKIDISKEGSVSWDQLAQHMLLQFYERDDKVKSTQLPQWRDIRMIPAPHKDVIQRVDFLRSSHKYVTVSREGTISLMSTDLEVSRTVRTSSDACKQRDLWVTDFVLLQNVSKVAVGFTSKEIAFYDISSKSDFSCQYRVQDLDASPICLDYWLVVSITFYQL
uniref:EF-hand domain-containing protein n=1 Tax=Macrostomum lignano TaxID=282301 RepID=A0A1I8HNF2_9PLAT